MSDKILFDPDKISIVEFKIIKDHIDTPDDFLIDKIVGYYLDNSLKLAYNLMEKLIRVDLTIDIKTSSNGFNAKEVLGNFHLIFIYRIENLEELAIPDKNDTIVLHSSLGNALSSITYSTSRGILISRVQGTALQNFMLPIINPNKLLID